METNASVENCPFGCGPMNIGYKFANDEYGAKLVHCSKCNLKFEIPDDLQTIESDISFLTLLLSNETNNPSQCAQKRKRYEKHLELLNKSLAQANQV